MNMQLVRDQIYYITPFGRYRIWSPDPLNVHIPMLLKKDTCILFIKQIHIEVIRLY